MKPQITLSQWHDFSSGLMDSMPRKGESDFQRVLRYLRKESSKVADAVAERISQQKTPGSVEAILRVVTSEFVDFGD